MLFGILVLLAAPLFGVWVLLVDSDFVLLGFVKISIGLQILGLQYLFLKYLSDTKLLMYYWEELLQGFLCKVTYYLSLFRLN